MTVSKFQDKLIKNIETRSSFKILNVEIPPQGMSSKVFFIKIANDKEIAVKYGKNAIDDVPALKLIQNSKIKIPIPKLYDFFEFEDTTVILMERIQYPLLDSIPVNQMERYIPSMIENLKKLHKITSYKPRLLTREDKETTWRDILLSIFNGDSFNWEEIASRKFLNHDLIQISVKRIKEKICNTYFPSGPYSLIHTDFNQRNLFVDLKSDQIKGIIDWEEAMFGDPIYDFARVRMLIWHFNLGEETIRNYYSTMKYTREEKERENLYWLSRVIQYLGWYSEEPNDFNLGRIQLHQKFLKEYDWNQK